MRDRVAGSGPQRAPERLSGAGAAVRPDWLAVLGVQRRAGNRAAGLLAGRLSVQRCGPVPCDCGPAEREAAEASQVAGVAGPVQRLHQDFFITGKLVEPKTDRFQFDRGSAVLDHDEVAKAAAYADLQVSQLRLRATVSEDEDPGLVADRIAAVEQALLGVAPGTGPAQRDPQPNAGRGNKNYRLVRRVVVTDTQAAPTGPDCSKGPHVPCPEPNPFVPARARAGELIKQAVQALGQLDGGAGVAMETYFRDRQHAERVVGALTKIAGQLGRYEKEIAKGTNAKGGFKCHNECDSVVVANEGVGADAVLTLGPAFLASQDPDKQALTILHEASHGTPGLETDDHAYEWQRLLPFLSADTAAKNADSYAGLVGAIIGRPVGNTVGPDQYTGISADDERGTTEMLGWLEQYVISTRQEIGSLHWSMANAAKTGKWQSGPYRNQIFPAVGAAFPEASRVVLDPATPPSPDHVSTIGGCYDQLLRLSDGVKDRKLSLTVGVADAVVWEQGTAGPGTRIELPASFFGKSGTVRVELLLDAMLLASPAIAGGRRAGYRQLILARGRTKGRPD